MYRSSAPPASRSREPAPIPNGVYNKIYAHRKRNLKRESRFRKKVSQRNHVTAGTSHAEIKPFDNGIFSGQGPDNPAIIVAKTGLCFYLPSELLIFPDREKAFFALFFFQRNKKFERIWQTLTS